MGLVVEGLLRMGMEGVKAALEVLRPLVSNYRVRGSLRRIVGRVKGKGFGLVLESYRG